MDIQQLIDGQQPTLVEVFASWCPHCQRMMPIVANLKEIYAGKANIVQYDGDAHPEVDKAFGVDSYPTFILYKEGREVWRQSGEMQSWELEDILDKYL